jgi:hypothetical protein
MNRSAPFAPHPLKRNGAKSKRQAEGKDHLQGGWSLPSLPLGCTLRWATMRKGK